MFTHLLFDADNTLLDFEKAQFCGLRKVLSHYNIVFSEKIYKEYCDINHSLWRLLEQGKIVKEQVVNRRFSIFFEQQGMIINGEEANLFYQDTLKSQSWLMPHALEVCRSLSDRYSISIVTNGVGVTQESRIINSEIYPYIDNLFISELVGYEKPNVLFFNRVLDCLQISSKDEVLIVGDSLFSDIKGGLDFGISTCWYNYNGCDNNSVIIPNYTITDLLDLETILHCPIS